MKTKKIIEQFIRNLTKKISPEMIILFGSTARGNRLAESDIDIIVISNDFDKMPLDERFRTVYTAWPPQIDADIIPLTKKEFEKASKKSIALKDAQKYWKIIQIPQKNTRTKQE